MPLRVLVLHGPNLSWGERQRAFDGLEAQLRARAAELGVELESRQANGESELLAELFRHRDWADAAIINPSSLAPVAYGLADALALWGKAAVEVLLEHESKGRGKSALRKVVRKQFHGQGFGGYLKALEAVVKPPSKGAPVDPPRQNDSSNVAPATHAGRLRRGGKGKGTRGEVPLPKTLGRGAHPANESERRGAPRAQSGSARPERPSRPADERAPVDAAAPKTIGRAPPTEPAEAAKTIGRSPHAATSRGAPLSRAQVRQQISERLGQRLDAAALCAWARARWQELQAGAEAEPGHRELLDEVLLALAGAPLGDDALLTLMAKL